MAMGVTSPEFEVCSKMEMCLACNNIDWLVEIWPGTGSIYGRSDKENNDENDDDRDLPTIEELLLAKLQEQGFATEDRGPDKTGGVEEAAADEMGGSIDESRSAQSDNSSRNPGERAHYTFYCGNRRPVFSDAV
jgi:hypothetical protein